MNTTNEIATKISSLRKEVGWSQKELAEKLFVSPSTVSKWENGDATPDIHRIKEIAEAFQVSVVELIGETAINEVNKQTGERIQVEKNSVECTINNVTGKQCCEREAKLIDENSFKNKKKYSKKKFFLGAFLGMIFICFIYLRLQNYHTDATYGFVEFKIVDEFLDETSKHWGYDSIYHVVVEFEGELNSDAQITYGENLRKKYRKHLNKGTVINVVFLDAYKERNDVFNAEFYVYLLPKEK